MRKINLFLNILSIIIIALVAFYIIDMRRKAQSRQETISTTPTATSGQNRTATPTQMPQETEEAPKVSDVMIYLIAIGDEGKSGEEIGCQDSIVPVQVDVLPTTQPLHAAIQKLFDTGQYYGESGLYNALYQSDLDIQSIEIQNTHAIIRLTGTLRSGGVCDDPRIEEQLRRTALGFETVQTVSVFINGEEL